MFRERRIDTTPKQAHDNRGHISTSLTNEARMPNRCVANIVLRETLADLRSTGAFPEDQKAFTRANFELWVKPATTWLRIETMEP